MDVWRRAARAAGLEGLASLLQNQMIGEFNVHKYLINISLTHLAF